MSNLIRALIVDDHGMTRAGIKFFIEQDPTIKVVGEASNGEEALAVYASLNPDIIVMDLYLPIVNGIETSKSLLAKYPEAKIIILTSHSGKNEVTAALAVGVRGYCLKDVSNTRLVSAIQSVFNGDLWIDSSIVDSFLWLLSQQSNAENNEVPTKQIKAHGQSRFSLSERELKVLELIVAGKTNQEIANDLFLSVDTIKSHLKTVMSKLNVDDRTQAAVKAVREGLTQ